MMMMGNPRLSWPGWWLYSKMIYPRNTVIYLRNNRVVSWLGIEPTTKSRKCNITTDHPPSQQRVKIMSAGWETTCQYVHATSTKAFWFIDYILVRFIRNKPFDTIQHSIRSMAFKGKVPPYSITKRWAQSWYQCTCSQCTGNFLSHPVGRLPLISTRPAVTFTAEKRHSP